MAAGIAPYTHDGALAYGTMLPAPLRCAASEVPLDSDGLDLLVMPSPSPVQAAGPEPAGPKMSQRVIDLIARGALQRTAVLTPIVTGNPNTPSPMPQARLGPVAEVIARIAAVSAERCEVTRRSDQAERDRCAATARLLASAGWCDRAEAIMAAAPHPMHHAAPPPPASDVVVAHMQQTTVCVCGPRRQEVR